MRRFGFASFGLAVLGVAAFVACDDTVDAVKLPPDAGAATDAPVDAPVTTTDGGADSATVDGGSDAGDPVARGKYIVENLAACGDCHTPRKVDGSPDMAKRSSKNSCDSASPRDQCGLPSESARRTSVHSMASRSLSWYWQNRSRSP